MVNLAWRRYERQPGSTYRDQDDYDKLHAWLVRFREDADLVTADLVAAATQREPDPSSKPWRWTFERVNHAIQDYEARHGRRPTKAEFNTDPTLPFYTQVRRTLGPNPLRTLDL